MRIFVAPSPDLLPLLEDGPLRREEVEVRALPEVGGPAQEIDLIVLAPDTGTEELERMRRSGVAAPLVTDPGELEAHLGRLGLRARHDERVPVHVPARLHAGGTTLEGTTKDVSLSGVFVHCEPALEVGTEGELVLEAGQERIEARARVARVQTKDGYRLDGVGLAWIDPDRTTRQALEDLRRVPTVASRIPRLRYRA